jgi:hypothetical protein
MKYWYKCRAVSIFWLAFLEYKISRPILAAKILKYKFDPNVTGNNNKCHQTQSNDIQKNKILSGKLK